MPRGGIWRPPVSFRGGGVSVPTGHTGPAPVPVHGSIQVVRAPRVFLVSLSLFLFVCLIMELVAYFYGYSFNP